MTEIDPAGPAAAPASNAFPHTRPKGCGSRPSGRVAQRAGDGLPGAVAEVEPPPADGPGHYVLSKETWAIILQEYVDGATVPELASKWRVSKSAVRAQITRNKMTKRDHGDAAVRAQAEARAAEIEAARAETPEARAARLFVKIPGEDFDKASDPAALGRLATLASGRAMTGRLWAEARALAGLAESYARLEEKRGAAGGGTLSIETMDLRLLLEVVVDADYRVTKRFERRFEGRDDPDDFLKQAYWAFHDEMHKAVTKNLHRLMLRALWAEKRLSALGHDSKLEPVDIEIEVWGREYLSAPMSEANVTQRAEAAAQIWRNEAAREAAKARGGA